MILYLTAHRDEFAILRGFFHFLDYQLLQFLKKADYLEVVHFFLVPLHGLNQIFNMFVKFLSELTVENGFACLN